MLQHADVNTVAALDDISKIDVAHTTVFRAIVACEAATQCNRLSLISRLPPEILIEIFTILRDIEMKDSLHWIMWVTHVCSDWRNVALNCPTLWNKLTVKAFKFPEFAREMLIRSKMMLLEVKILKCNKRRYNRDIIKATLSQIHRTKTIRLHLDEDSFAFISRLIRFASFLESCKAFFTDSSQTLPAEFLQNLPSLRHLTLQNCIFRSWETPLSCFANLRTLSMSDLGDFKIRPNVTVTRVLSALRSMTCLEILVLGFNFDTAECDNLYDHVPTISVSLPQLRFLKLRCRFHHCSFLLRHLVFSDTAAIVLMIPDRHHRFEKHFGRHYFADAAEQISAIVGKKTSSYLKYLRVEAGMIDIRATPDPQIYTSSEILPTNQCAILIDFSELICDDMAILVSDYFLPALSLEHLESLRILTYSFLSGPSIRDFFAYLPSLHDLTISESEYPRFFYTLVHPKPSSMPDVKDPSPTSFKALRCLSVRYYKFRIETLMHHDGGLDCLLWWLSAKCKRNCKLQHLMLDHLGELTWDDVKALQQVVTKVEVL